ncbi:EthD domain-containing protein [Paraburkholderia unamae]|uniref:EthD domain-containing protein n=1 Tax=Paraburkholderia unamae TaxID=219649 RepID=UPI001CACD06C|nr:EthD domain-containing protein [Paraburkholderia unamae]CAG9275164.1 EthD domain-containing protein [Paraburkholderia unamae]
MTSSKPRQKPLYLLKRLPTISHEQFCDHWYEVHPTVLKSIPEWVQLRSGYVQNHLIGSGNLSDWRFPYDGVTQVYLRAGTEGGPPFPELPVFRERVIPDENTFLDRERTIVLKTLEHVVVPGSSRVKVFIFHRRRADLSLQEFTDLWTTQQREIVLNQKDFTRELRGYRQNVLIAGQSRYLAGNAIPAHEEFDGASELWFDSVEAAEETFRKSAYKSEIGDGSSSPFDSHREIACLVDPRVILPE